MPATGWTTSSSRSSVSPPPSPAVRRAAACDRGTGDLAGPDGRRRRRLADSSRRDPAGRPSLAGPRSGRRPRPIRARRSWCPVGHPRRFSFFVESAGGRRRRTVRCDDPASREAPRRSRRGASASNCRIVLFPLGGRRFRLGAAVGFGRFAGGSALTGCGGGRAVGLSPGFLNRGDEFVLAHARRPLDAGSIGQRAQFGQHHGGQGARPLSTEGVGC